MLAWARRSITTEQPDIRAVGCRRLSPKRRGLSWVLPAQASASVRVAARRQDPLVVSTDQISHLSLAAESASDGSDVWTSHARPALGRASPRLNDGRNRIMAGEGERSSPTGGGARGAVRDRAQAGDQAADHRARPRRRLKRDGIDGSGVATLMADAGLTNGAFYAHFPSKDDLVATAVADQLREQRESLSAGALAAPESSRAWRVPFGPAPRQRGDGLPVRRPARRDRPLHRRHQAGVHRRPAGRHRRRRRPPGAARSALGTREDAQRLRPDGRDTAALPRPERPGPL